MFSLTGVKLDGQPKMNSRSYRSGAVPKADIQHMQILVTAVINNPARHHHNNQQSHQHLQRRFQALTSSSTSCIPL